MSLQSGHYNVSVPYENSQTSTEWQGEPVEKSVTFLEEESQVGIGCVVDL